MTDEDTRPEAVDGFELLAASLRAATTDTAVFARVLADKLAGALPGQVTVERRRAGLLGGKSTISRVDCTLGGRRYSLDVSSSRLDPRRATVVRGVVLKTEQLSLDDWIDALARDLAAEAQVSERSRLAVEQLLHEGVG